MAMLIYLLITGAILWASRKTHPDEFQAMLITFGLGLAAYGIGAWREYRIKQEAKVAAP
jgi:hypothetical protein